MEYSEKTGVLTVTAAEMVVLSLRRLQSETANDLDDFAVHPLTQQERVALALPPDVAPLTLDVEQEGYCLHLVGEVDELPSDKEKTATLRLSRAIPCEVTTLPREVQRRLRGEGFLLAHCAFSRFPTLRSLTLRTLRYHRESATQACDSETVTCTQAAQFFSRVLSCLEKSASVEIDRVVHRLPTMRDFPFPYRAVRQSQDALIQAVWHTVRRRGRLYACAPTGTGKTAAVLYPALRALGKGTVDRIFYLTPKTTTTAVACHTLQRFAHAGAEVRAVCLTAKERLCPRQQMCRDPRTPCDLARAGGKREEQAALELLEKALPVVGAKEILAQARACSVCPYELSLRYSQFCDVILCDYNYLFDTRVYLRRFFDRLGHYCFLIDEAHDLLERARQMYSTSLSRTVLEQVLALATQAGDTAVGQAAQAACHAFDHTIAPLQNERTYTDEQGVVHAFAAQKRQAEELLSAVEALCYALAQTLHDRHQPYTYRCDVRPLWYTLQDVLARQRFYGPAYETFLRRDGATCTVQSVCLDPGTAIDACLSRGDSAVLFSATLEPLDYYRTVLGGGKEAQELLLESPFDRDRLCICVTDKISTRFSDREESAPRIAAAIHTMVSGRMGNYFVFCPSYAYMETVARVFHARYPSCHILCQERHASPAAREAFLARFVPAPQETLVGFCVTGGVYAEGIDLPGDRLIGAAVIGVGLPQPSPERDAMCAYYDDRYERGKEYAYAFPGMNRVLQAAGRVIRQEEDRGVLLLIDDRFAEPLYRQAMPTRWHGLKYVGDVQALGHVIGQFWRR